MNDIIEIVIIFIITFIPLLFIYLRKKEVKIKKGEGDVKNNNKQSRRSSRNRKYVILPRIGICGIATESSTFSPARTVLEDFLITEGDELFNFYPFFHINNNVRKRANWIPLMKGRALPGGIVTKKAYNKMVKRIIDLLTENLPFDGLFFDIHGAMSVEGIDDPEGDLIIKIREIVGTKTIISSSMDLHGNVSWRLAKHTDLITCFRLAPHEDRIETKQRAVENLLERIEKGLGKPKYKAWIPIPILLPGEKTSTRIEPGKSLYARVAPATEQKGVIDAAIWIGYAWADENRNHGVVMAYGDVKEKVAEDLALNFWKVREQFVFVAPTAPLDECIDKAIASRKHPFFISDMGDNPTAGGAGDVTWSLQKILKREEFKKENGPTLIYASIPGEKFVEQALKIGIGGKVDGFVGAIVDSRYAPPIRLVGTVHIIKNGDKYAMTEVVVKVGSCLFIIVTKKRKPYLNEIDYLNLNLNPRKTDIVIVKLGYLTDELFKIQKDWIMALTPGGVDQDIEKFTYKRITRPMFPFDKDMNDPCLKALFVP